MIYMYTSHVDLLNIQVVYVVHTGTCVFVSLCVCCVYARINNYFRYRMCMRVYIM